MKSSWSIDEILIRLPIANMKLRAANVASKEGGLYVSADLNRSGQLIADRPEASGWEAFTLTLAS